MNPNTPEQRTPKRRCKPPESVGQPDLPNWSVNIPRDFTRQTPIKTRDGERKNPPGSRTHVNPDLPSSTLVLQEASSKEGAAKSPMTSADLQLQHPPTALRSIKITSGQLRLQETAGKIPEKEPTGSRSRARSPDPEDSNLTGPSPTPENVKTRWEKAVSTLFHHGDAVSTSRPPPGELPLT
jgi:hypothetical protein